MSEYKRVSGELHNIEESLANRAAIELIDDYQMSIYELMKLIDEDVVGYIATCEEVFDVLLSAASHTNDRSTIPKVIFIISDMEFDHCTEGAGDTAFEHAKGKWAAEGLELPTVVFWNVDARSDNLPVTKFDKNVVLVSGSNQSAFRFALQGKTPIDLMNEVINSERYSNIKA